MRLLVLGGTCFLGRAVVLEAVARGHEVDLFHRGLHPSDAPPQVRRLRGNRLADVSALSGESWDAVIDTSARHPLAVSLALELPSIRRAHMTLVSSISVYAAFPDDGPGPDTPLVPALGNDALGDEPPTYGGRKAGCEALLRDVMGDDALVVRPGLIVGPRDMSGRLAWWHQRMRRPGPVVAPGSPEAPVQLVDVDDLACFLVDLSERQYVGTLDAVGPRGELTMGALLSELSGDPARLRWVPDEVLVAQGVRPMVGLPLWLPRAMHGVFRVDGSEAEDLGLGHRPWWERVGRPGTECMPEEPPPIPVGIDEALEATLLRAAQG